MQKTFADVLTIKNGKNQKAVENPDGKYPIYGSGGIMGRADSFICHSGTVIIGRKGSINNPIFAEEPLWNVDTAFGLEADPTQLTPKYLYYFCKQFDFTRLNKAVTIPSLTKTDLLQITMEVPCLEKQASVVGTLDKIAKIIALRKRQLEELDTLVKARFVEMFGDLGDPACKWETCMLSEACEKPDDIKCGPFGTQLSKDEYQNSGVAVWEIPQINSQFTTTPTHFVTKNKAEILSAYSLVPGDIAMSRKGNVGKCAVFPNVFEAGIIHSDVLRIRLDYKKADPIFMMNQLHNSTAIQNQIAAVSNGAVMSGINVTKLKRIEVYLPPLKLQNQFSEFVAQIDKSKVVVQKALDEAQLLFDSLMQQYFR